ncbi:F0F1 ATP synthase subunit delta [Kushneria phosphatilytica]|uniref:ATP synthase subunit delta n=1 Tax=Kushneria phosphatilytica TaxID=657387 RepID=A0A1S1NS88_9GAMM|nr:F0F1 ATP synthase subunit delta [Kushneria phosphatilytica]OHV08884.1 F0F1 ATP synthase subunit delta [Kushneria phosphatilytica]QEL12606.1 F0F1 ATP synthase subunit delta [Kushneria phosphatilytica]
MADNAPQARPYAKAAFELAREQQAVDQWSTMLAEGARVVLDERVATWLADPTRTAAEQADTLIELLGETLDERGREFIRVLARQHRLAALPAISELFEAERAEYERVAVVEVISAFELSQTQQDSLARALKKRLDREITMTTSVDRTLLGGVIIRSGDTVIDGSARGRLARLKRDLNA